jgi:carbonic anhydrase/acetyltransferase-like protein (isoleucine patch superfamily)
MASRKEKKYKLIRSGKRNPRGKTNTYFTHKTYQLQALRDIPEHGVKAGDLGGFVTQKNTLSHEGSCWIGPEAEALGYIFIQDDAYVGDTASLRTGGGVHAIRMHGKSRVTGNAIIEMARYEGDFNTLAPFYILDEAHIYGDALLQNCRDVSEKAKVYGNAWLRGVKEVTDNSEIFGEAFLDKDAIVIGNSKIHGKARIEEKATIRSSDISGNVIIPKYDTIGERVLTEQKKLALAPAATPALPTAGETKALTSKKSRLLTVYNDIRERIASYEKDIVKIIKYPTMTDQSNASTLAMTMALSSAERLVDDPDCDDAEFAEAVTDLEAKFLIAESNAFKIASTALTEDERKKMEKAKDLLAIASNEGSTEHEKKVSFKQAFKQLEGVLVVPEVAMDTFRVKIGLQELEA